MALQRPCSGRGSLLRSFLPAARRSEKERNRSGRAVPPRLPSPPHCALVSSRQSALDGNVHSRFARPVIAA